MIVRTLGGSLPGHKSKSDERRFNWRLQSELTGTVKSNLSSRHGALKSSAIKVDPQQSQEKGGIVKRRNIFLKSLLTLIVLSLFGILIALNCSDKEKGTGPSEPQSSRAYEGHANDADMNNFAKAYQNAIGTRLDDCQTCHTGGVVSEPKVAGDIHANPCDYCHYINHPPEGWTGLPTTIEETLNPYGADYKDAGHNYNAILAVANLDSDGDGHTNVNEINALRYPGDAGSYPGLDLCPVVKVTMAEIQAMSAHTQFGLANTTKQQYDFYATYTGVKIKDILEAKGIYLTGASSVDILAPDGFARTFTIDQITKQYPDHRFYSQLGVEEYSEEKCAFVEYPNNTYELADGAMIGQEQWHILAYQREGLVLESSYLDLVSGKIEGEGPFRNIIPPGSDDDEMNRPDRGKNWDTSGCPDDEWNYVADKDHNAGSMVKGVVIIRINPMPGGCEEFDIINGGWAMIDEGSILIYGHNVEGE
jgi:hypothetical protein